MKKSLLVLPLALLALALALSACGGGGSSSSSGGGEETAIEKAIETAATSSNPSICSEFQTENFNEKEHPEGNALKECEESTEGGEGAAESVSVANVGIEGETATAEAAITGGPLGGQSVGIELSKEEGDWKLNEFTGFTKYDGAALGAALEEQFAGEKGVTASVAKCVSQAMAAVSQEEAEAVVFEQSLEPIEEAAGSCK